MNNNILNQISESSELDVLLTLKRNIFKNLKVGSFGQIKSINEDEQTAMVSLFPSFKNESEIIISATYLNSIPVNENDVVVILFLDTNFKSTLRQTLKQQKRTSLTTNNVVLHDINYGVIIANVNAYNILSITNEEIDEICNKITIEIIE